jgi:hypothetical protein
MEVTVEKTYGNENLLETIPGTDCERFKNNWRMWNISTICVA